MYINFLSASSVFDARILRWLWIPAALLVVFAVWRVMRYLLRRPVCADIENAGFAYDTSQDMFYSLHDAWQRRMGYSGVFDATAAFLSMIIDCEPVKFEYGGKSWLIELWKGQYGMTTGAEIGVYTHGSTEHDDFYMSASDADMLDMSYYLLKNGRLFLERNDRHWWLTSFRLGEFSEPENLTMYIKIVMKDYSMRDAFATALRNAGYSDGEIMEDGLSVGLIYTRPKSVQPVLASSKLARRAQKRNKKLCEAYRRLTGGADARTALERLQLRKPSLYRAATRFAKNPSLFENKN